MYGTLRSISKGVVYERELSGSMACTKLADRLICIMTDVPCNAAEYVDSISVLINYENIVAINISAIKS